jgi:Peptidase family M48
MTTTLAIMAPFGIALPHLLPLERVSAPIAIALWLAALALRAVSVALGVLLMVLYLPATGAFSLLTNWCWHAVIPFMTAHVGFSGHSLGHMATVVPLVVASLSALSVGWTVRRAGRSMRQLLSTQSLGIGPMDSVIVGGSDVVLAAAGLARPRVIVSAGALALLDDAELTAGLGHERGHIARNHRFILLFGQVCRALSRIVPGGRTAIDELAFHLERDADAFALAHRGDRFALASAICKAAQSGSYATPVTALANGRSALGRVRLLTGERPRRRRAVDPVLACTAAVMATLAIGLVAWVPSVAAAGVERVVDAVPTLSCPA